ncbi:MAG: c-type cytochrome [Bacteroidia bacterium]
MASAWAQQEEGKQIFAQRCAACHKPHQKLVGPALASSAQKREESWFIKFVRNSQELIKSGDPEAVAVYNEYNQQIMPPHLDLSEEQIRAVYAYLKEEALKVTSAPEPKPVAQLPAAAVSTTRAKPSSSEWSTLQGVFWVLGGIAVIVSLFLGMLINFMSQKKAGLDGGSAGS